MTEPRGHYSGIYQAPLRRVVERVDDLYDAVTVWERYEPCGHWFPAKLPPFGTLRPRRRCWPCAEQARATNKGAGTTP
jgi:hypothetical protein